MNTRSSSHWRWQALGDVSQSIRFRLTVLFFLAFLAISGFGVWQLKTSLSPAFLRIELDDAHKSAERVIGIMDAQFSSLSTLNRDWANWDDMYEFILRPTPRFLASNMPEGTLKSAGLNAILVLRADGKVVVFKTLPLSDGKVLTEADLVQIRIVLNDLIKDTKTTGRCGYIKPYTTPLLACVDPVLRSNGTGPHVGGVVMLRELGPSLMKDIATQSKERFELTEPNSPTPEASPLVIGDRWLIPAFVHLPASSVKVQFSEHILRLHMNISGLTGQPLIGIRLPLDRAIVIQGQQAIRQMAIQLGFTVFTTCILLLLIVHFGFVVPLRGLRSSIRAIHENKQWQTEVDGDRRDEIGGLAREVNGLLGVIRGQVSELLALSLTDALTGLANRRRFDQRLAEEMNRLQRVAQPMSMLMIDIDYFKQFNDHYGHPAGDMALKQVAQVLYELTRKNDLPARMGGEEFAVMLINTDEAAAVLIAEKLVRGVHAAQIPHAKSQVNAVLTVSIGVATVQPQQDTAEQFIQHADMALYAAKAAGRNQVASHSNL